jgi:hypothetical protein
MTSVVEAPAYSTQRRRPIKNLEIGNFCLVASPHLEVVYHGVRVICREDPGGARQGD